jgi:hypothetical protein
MPTLKPIAAALQRIGLFVVGQSNETGQGLTAGYNTGFGPPIVDPTKPNGQAGKRSWYPTLARLMADKGAWLDVFNYALGGSSVVYTWVGCITPWASGMLTKKGMYARTSDGGLWRADLANASSGPAASVEPAGTSNTTGADTIPWTYIGNFAALGYALGVVSRKSPLFDPTGQLGAIKTAAQAYAFRRWLDFSIGQTDATMSYPSLGGKVTRGLYSSALQELALWAIETGLFERVFLGHSCSGDSTMNGYYDTVTVPGTADALAALALYPQVVAGANLYKALGALTVNDASGNGLQSDGLHMQDNMYEASAAVRAALMIPFI